MNKKLVELYLQATLAHYAASINYTKAANACVKASKAFEEKGQYFEGLLEKEMQQDNVRIS